MIVESMPPDKKAPSGTSDSKRRVTASVVSVRTRSVASAYESRVVVTPKRAVQKGAMRGRLTSPASTTSVLAGGS